ncbi:MAG: glycosyltransferase [Betaproteobacteria bacterium]
MQILLPILRDQREQTFYQDFHRGLADGLRALGHEPVEFSFQSLGEPRQEEAERLLRQLDGAKIGAVLDLCCWAYGLSQITLEMQGSARKSIFDVFDIRYVGLLCDQPYHQALNGIGAQQRYAAYPDRGHPEQVKLAFPDFKLTGEIFVPPAIRPANDRSVHKGSPDRSIDVLYVGNLETLALDRFWNDRLSLFWQGEYDPVFCDALTETALSEPDRSFHLNIQTTLEKLGPPIPGFLFNPQMRAVETYLRYVLRRNAVVALARSGVRMRVVGRGWDTIQLPSNVELQGETNYEEFFKLAGQAKICLDASMYLDGANDRVFSYALNGAVCFTNAAGYLRGAFGENQGMCFYSMRDLAGLVEQVKALLARPDAIRAAGERAREIVLSSHTWRSRVGDLLGALPPKPAEAGGRMTSIPPPARRQ